MDTPSERARNLLARMSSDSPIEWETPEDLARASILGTWGSRDQARTVRSSGSVRIFGTAVRNHQARLDAAGHILLNLQRLVTAAGAAKRGVMTNRGQLSADIVALTQLRLTMNPLPGSVVFEFGPETLPEVELAATGLAIFDEDRRQFVDECVEDAFALVRTAHDVGPSADDSAFVRRVTEGGPRLASAIREFAKGVEQSSLDVDLEWREPDRPTTRVTFTKADAEQVRRLVVARELDQDEVTLRGRLVTLSTEASWQIDLGDNHRVTVDPSTMSDDVDITRFHLDESVEVRAKPQVKEFPGGGSTTLYRAISARSIETHDATTA